MSIRHRAGGYQALLTIDGRQYTATLPTREEARDWERLVRARAVTGMLARRVTVRDYAAHWILGYETAPTNTRVFHEVNLERSSRHSARPGSARSPRRTSPACSTT